MSGRVRGEGDRDRGDGGRDIGEDDTDKGRSGGKKREGSRSREVSEGDWNKNKELQRCRFRVSAADRDGTDRYKGTGAKISAGR